MDEKGRNRDIANELLRRIRLNTLKRIAEMKFGNRETALTNSKLGGVPFIPVGSEYPKNQETGEGLHFLLQINFSEMPPIPDFPTEGILQIFIAEGDDLWEWAGVETEEFSRQNKWRILYHEDISDPMPREEVMALMPGPPVYRDYDPIFSEYGKEYLIEFDAQDMPICWNDFRFRDTLIEYGRDIIPNCRELQEEDLFSWPREYFEVLYDPLFNGSSRVSGYPFNQQGDPRELGAVPENYELLLQIEDIEDKNGEYIFSMGGPATFFIDPEDLKKRDFSKVYFYIDFD